MLIWALGLSLLANPGSPAIRASIAHLAPGYDPRLDRPPSRRALEEARAALRAICPKADCGSLELVENRSIGNNAVTWVSGMGQGRATQAKLVYARDFLNALDDHFGAGASFGILAHEVGHQKTAAEGLRQPGEPIQVEELRADYLAGCALARVGRSPDELQHALSALGRTASASHPPFKDRVTVVQKGYQDCLASEAQSQAPIPGCRFRFQSVADRRRLGPVAAPWQRSKPYPSRKACERARRQNSLHSHRKACVCVR